MKSEIKPQYILLFILGVSLLVATSQKTRNSNQLSGLDKCTEETKDTIARCYSSQGNEEAERLNERGSQKAIAGDFEGAIKNYTKAISIDPNFAMAFNNRGHAYLMLGDYEQTVEDTTQAIKIDPLLYGAYYNRAEANLGLSKYSQSIADANKAIEIAPKDSSVGYNQRARAYKYLGNYEEARNNYDLAIKHVPNDPTLYLNRALLLKKIGEYEKALLDSNKAIDIDPKYINAYRLRVEIYKQLGKPKKAEKDLKTLHSLLSNQQQ